MRIVFKHTVSLTAVLWVALGASFLGADVTTEHNDNNRTGANLSEVVLNTSNVNVGSFGKLFSRAVDGHIYAQPLYVSNVTIPGQGVHNVVFVCTQHNSVYAYDADVSSASTPLWTVNLGPSVPISVFGTADQEGISVEVGILSTPVIDPTSNTIYVIAQTYESSQVIFRLHALDFTTGAEKPSSPVMIQGSVAGQGTDSVGGIVTFGANKQLQRPGLLLLNGSVYVAFGSHGDDPVWHGWLIGYNAATLQQVSIFCTSPNSDSSGIWQSGIGPAATSTGNIILETGNGLFDANTGGLDYGDSILKLSTAGGISVVDYFSPSNQATLDAADDDLGAGGPVLIVPGTLFGVAAGKDGRLMLFNTNDLGQFNSAGDQIAQIWQATPGSFFGGSVFYNSTLYAWGSSDVLKAYSFSGSAINTTPASQSTVGPSGFGNTPAMSISANGTSPGTGIVWASFASSGNPHAGAPTPGILHALDASNVSNDLWNSNQQVSRDSSGSWAKFNPPTIANGKVYLGTFDGVLNVFGLLAPPGQPASVTASGGTPQSATIGTVFAAPLRATVQDSNDNLLKGVSVTFTAPTSGPSATFGGSSTVTVSTGPNGVATTPALTANTQAGSYTVTATVSGVSAGANFILANTTAASVTAIAGGSQSAVVNAAFGTTLQAKVLDGSSNPVSGVTVTFTAPTGAAGALFGGSATVAVVTNGSGIAISPVPVANTVAGAYTVTASAAGVATPANFSLTNTAGAPASLVATSGTPQSTPVNTAFAAALQVTVRDGFGNRVSGATVTFTAPGSGASALFSGSATTAVATNASGIAISPVPVANSTVGSYNVSASAPGLTAVTFALTNGATPPPAAVTFVKTDTATQGTWKGVYGSDGYNVIGDLTSNPSYVTPVPSGQSSYTWSASTSDVRALQMASNPADRIAAAWFSTTQFTIDMNISDTLTHQVALYCLDWDSTTRRQTINVLDGSGNVLNTQALTSSFNGGVYLVWNVSGHVQFQITRTAGSNGVISGLFFDPALNTQTISATGGTPQSTVVSTAFPAALQATVKNGSGNPVSGVMVTFTAPGSGASALFGGSATAAVVTNGSGIAISPVPVANSLVGSYNVSASAPGLTAVTFALTNSATSSPGAAAFVKTDSATQGTWKGVYGSDGYNVIGDLASNPSYVTPIPSGQSSDTWTGLTSDVRALQKASNPTVRIAAAWFSTTQFTIDMNISDTLTHQVALYCLDWDSTTRRQTINVLDGSGNVLNTQALTSSFNGGVYLVWNVSGHVQFQITRTAGSNGVISGLFFDPALNTQTISATGGTPQSTVVSTAFPAALQATVKNGSGNPVSGVTVTFTAPGSGASALFSGSATAAVVTNGSGIAISPVPVANSLVGSYNVTASAPGLTAVTFALTNSAASSPGAAAFVKTDTATQGTWKGVYGSDGYNVIGDLTSNPSYVTPIPSGQSSYTWSASTSDVRALQKASNPAVRIAAAWFSTTQFTIDMNISDTLTHQVALYCLDWDSTTRRQTINVLDGSGNVLNTQALTSSFNGGVYLVWNVSGHVQFQITRTAGSNGVISGLFFDPALNTQTISATGGTPQSTVVSTAFPAALQATVKNGSGNPVSGVMVTFTAPGSGASALFGGSATAAVVTNGSGIAISPVPVANSVVGSYNVSASAPGLTAVSFALTNSATPPPPTATFVQMDTATQGNWEGVYGSDGYNVIGDLTSNPSYVTPIPSGQSSYTWTASTSDVRALQKASNPAVRIAATWYSSTQFTIDMNITDSATHQVALYCLDWDSTARRQTINVLDGSGNLLNTQALTSSFNGGVYMVWNVSGHVQFQVTRTAGNNAVLSGLFFEP